MDQPIRIGLVGLGRAGGGMHRGELRSRQDKFHFYAVCDIIEERTVPFVEAFLRISSNDSAEAGSIIITANAKSKTRLKLFISFSFKLF
jgi:hypothetical protein